MVAIRCARRLACDAAASGTSTPPRYARHPLHCADRAWPEANCYVDLWVELLHTAGAEPLAALPFALAVDVEGDQWTFFKFPLADLEALYGVSVFELNVWRPLVAPRGGAARPGPALDRRGGCLLPARHRGHVLPCRARQDVDRDPGPRPGRPAARLLPQRRLLRTDAARTSRACSASRDTSPIPSTCRPTWKWPSWAPAAADRPRPRRGLACAASGAPRAPAGRRTPSAATPHAFARDLEWLADEPLSCFHNYAFATLRQCGAAFELAGAYLRWLEAGGECGLERAAEGCELIATTAKALQFKTARAVNTRRPLDAAPMLEKMAGAWDETMTALTARYGA